MQPTLYDAQRKRICLDWIEKAKRQVDAAEFHYQKRQWSECVQAAQEAIELSVKAILALLNIDYPQAHRLGRDELCQVAKQLRGRRILDQLNVHLLFRVAELPRLLVLANLWADTNVTAKYGLEAGLLASPEALFKGTEARLAANHAQECHLAAFDLVWAPEEVLCVLTCNDASRAG